MSDVYQGIIEERKRKEPHPDTVRLDWLMHNLSGNAWRDAGVIYPDGSNRRTFRDAIDARMEAQAIDAAMQPD